MPVGGNLGVSLPGSMFEAKMKPQEFLALEHVYIIT